MARNRLERAVEALYDEIQKLDRRSASAILKQINIIRDELGDVLTAFSAIAVGELPWAGTPIRKSRRRPKSGKR